MWPRFGLKIGNSTLCLTTAKEDGKLEIVANKHGDRVSQAILLMEGKEIDLGLTAKQKMLSRTALTVTNSFQFLRSDLTEEDIETASKHISCQYDSRSNKFLLPDNSNEELSISPYRVCVEFFKSCFELARQCHLSEEQPSVVLSIPLYYSKGSWELLYGAAEEAGFQVEQIVPEPAVAVLACNEAEDGDPSKNLKNVLFIKTGGLLTSFTLMKIYKGLYSIVESDGPFYIGGQQITDSIVEHISVEFYRKYRLDPKESRRSMLKIQNAAENCKHILTTLQTTQVYIDSLMDGIDFNLQISRARFDNLIQPVINEIITKLDEFTSQIDQLNQEETPQTIDEIVLCGGTMKIPKIQAIISSRFPNSKLNTNLSPDELIAIGCARQSLYIEPVSETSNVNKENLLISEVGLSMLPCDVFIWHDDNIDKKKLLFKKDTILPCNANIKVEESDSNAQAAALPLPNGSNNSSDIDDDDDDENEQCSTVFNVQMNNIIGEINVSNIKSNNGIYHVKSVVTEHNGCPRVKLLPAGNDE